MRTCTTCKEEKPLSEFGKDSYKADGLRPYCRKCGSDYSTRWQKANPEHWNAYRRENPAPSDDPDRHHGYLIKSKYGLLPEEYQAMLEAQDYCCAICKGRDEDRRLCVD